MAKFKLLKAYDAGGDLSKEWFVQYHFLKPRTDWKNGKPEYKRFKVCESINSIHTLRERKKQLTTVFNVLKDGLLNGFNPFDNFYVKDQVLNSEYSLKSCIAKYLSDIKGILSEGTTIHYKGRTEWLMNWFIKTKREDIMIFQVTKTDIMNFLTDCKKDNPDWSNKTYNHYLTDIKTFFNHFIKNYETYIKDNPADNIKKLRVLRKGNLPFSNEDFKRVLQEISDKDKSLLRFVKFLYYSCCRPDAEARFMKRRYFNLSGRTMMVPAELSKNGLTQYVPIDDEFYNFLVNELKIEKLDDDVYLFGKAFRPNGVPIYAKGYSRKFRKLKKYLNLPVDNTLYSFKHTRACHLAEDGVHLYRIQQITRHLTLANLMDYLKDMGVILEKKEPIKSRAI